MTTPLSSPTHKGRPMPSIRISRWFLLRHPDGFDEKRFAFFRVGCRVWRARVEAMLDEWDALGLAALLGPKPDYVFDEPRRGDDGSLSLGVGGNVSYGVLKTLEDDFPSDLLSQFPHWFQIDLELGRRDLHGFFPEVNWNRLFAAEAAETLRTQVGFRKPGK